jgi:hypothetical protein
MKSVLGVIMILMAILLSGLGFSADATKCYDLIVGNGKYPIVEAFYLTPEAGIVTIDSMIDPLIAELKKDSRLREQGREGLAQVQKIMLRAYPCTIKGEALFPSQSLNSYTYTCFPTVDGVLRISTKQFLALKAGLEDAKKIISADEFNKKLKIISSSLFEVSRDPITSVQTDGPKLLAKSEELSKEIERAARNRIKGPSSLTLNDKTTAELKKYCSADTIKAMEVVPDGPKNVPLRRRPGGR